MATRNIPSSRAFGKEAVKRFVKRSFQLNWVLVAGFGMGVTLAAVLDFDVVER